MPVRYSAVQYVVFEWGYTSSVVYEDPFNEIVVDVVFRHESGQTWNVPTYWAGEQEWRVRFAPPLMGHYHFETVCSDPNNGALHGQTGTLTAAAYEGTQALLRHGPLRVAANQRTLAFADGTPFFWLGDTWWFHLSKRSRFPDDFQFLTADRQRKGFNVIQIVAGLYPDMGSFDPRGVNEAGFPWEADYARINPAYFDMADLRIQWLVRGGLLPCILGSWGYYLPMLGAKRMKQHWRYLIARWSAYPVVWGLAGELAMPYYLDQKFGTGDDPELAAAWVEIGDYVRATDPYARLLTVHPTSNNSGRDQVTDERVMDFEMLQPGHDGYESVQKMLTMLHTARARVPTMPVLVDEINYEEQGANSHAQAQRLAFWAALLSGSCGFTYGASGLWAFNTKDHPWGASPHGLTWSDMTWDEAYQLAGAAQLGAARRLLERYAWWDFEPHQEWVSPAADADHYEGCFAAGIAGRVRVIYSFKPAFPWGNHRKYVLGLEATVNYRAFFWDPRQAREHDLGRVTPDAAGQWLIPLEPTLNDWVLVLEKSD